MIRPDIKPILVTVVDVPYKAEHFILRQEIRTLKRHSTDTVKSHSKQSRKTGEKRGKNLQKIISLLTIHLPSILAKNLQVKLQGNELGARKAHLLPYEHLFNFHTAFQTDSAYNLSQGTILIYPFRQIQKMGCCTGKLAEFCHQAGSLCVVREVARFARGRKKQFCN